MEGNSRRRPTPKKMAPNITSFFNYLQEAYKDCNEVKKKILAELKSRKDVGIEDTDDASAIGRLNNDNLKLLNDNVGKKIDILKVYSQVLKGSGVIGGTQEREVQEAKTLTMDEIRAARQALNEQQQKDSDGIKYEVE